MKTNTNENLELQSQNFRNQTEKQKTENENLKLQVDNFESLLVEQAQLFLDANASLFYLNQSILELQGLNTNLTSTIGNFTSRYDQFDRNVDRILDAINKNCGDLSQIEDDIKDFEKTIEVWTTDVGDIVGAQLEQQTALNEERRRLLVEETEIHKRSQELLVSFLVFANMVLPVPM
eukprot:Awhi_evm1s7984